MSPSAVSAFEDVSGGYFTVAQMNYLFAALGATIIFLYVVWLCISAYGEFGRGEMAGLDVVLLCARAIFVLSVLLFLLKT